METVFFQTIECHTYGSLPKVGSQAPEFHLTGLDLSDVNLELYAGKRVVLNIFPSLDTEVCALSVRRFNQEAAAMDNTVVVCASMDLPFAMGRFCAANGIENVVAASAFRSPMFGQNYGVELVDGPLKGLLTRAVVIIDEKGTVIYRDLVEQITNEPDYEAALKVLK
ncbi:MAG: thiol peroxidase [Muribaculaceae bacterium]|nr:thiol peroxidase [Muribaculaceae bacterium]